MINLSHINLSSIHLGGIDLSEIKLGYPSLGYSRENFDPASFDEAWTVTGKSNEDADRSTIKNLTGNGNDLVLTNFAFVENSGYGLYRANFYKRSDIEFYSKFKISFSKAQMEAQTASPNTVIAPLTNDLVFDIKLKVSGLKEGAKLKWGWGNSYIDITTDGIHVLEKTSDIRHLIVNFTSEFDPNQIITIEQIPEYEGYLVTDGVDDKVISGSFELGENWTMVGDWKFIDSKNVAAGIVKPSSFYIYDRINGLMVYINSDNAPKEIASIKSLKAVCSDGRCYDSNWNEILVEPGIIKRSGGAIHIGVQGSEFVQVAFKNLAFYNDKWLTKEQCIRAYDYLQTLKAK